MKKVKIKDVRDGSIKEVKKELADDFIGTGKFVLLEEKTEENTKFKNSFRKEE